MCIQGQHSSSHHGLSTTRRDSIYLERFHGTGRSHARTKEYVQELDAKLQGDIKKISDIQMAAQKIIDENSILRLLLRRQGLSESEIVEALRGLSGVPYDGVSSVQPLKTMLGRQMACSILPSTAALNPATQNAASTPRHTPSTPNCSEPLSPGSTVSYDQPRATLPYTNEAGEIGNNTSIDTTVCQWIT